MSAQILAFPCPCAPALDVSKDFLRGVNACKWIEFAVVQLGEYASVDAINNTIYANINELFAKGEINVYEAEYLEDLFTVRGLL